MSKPRSGASDTTGVRRPPRGDARRAILEAVLVVVACDGIDAVTHRRVAEQAGVSPGSTTHHFSSRSDLLREAFRYYMQAGDEMINGILTRLDATTSEPAERVVAFLTALVGQEFEHARMLRAEYELYLYASGDPDLAADVRRWDARNTGLVAADLERAGTARPMEAARTLLNLTRGFELERLIDPGLDPEQLRSRLELVLRSLR